MTHALSELWRGPVIRALLLAVMVWWFPSPLDGAPGGLDPERLHRLDELVERAIRKGAAPGAVLHLEIQGRRHVRAYGFRSLEPRREPMTEDTIFDLASLTKVVATTPLVLQLVEEGRLILDRPAAAHLPGFGVHGKDAITVRQLLTHTSGLAAGIPRAEFVPEDYDSGIAWILGCRPVAAPGERVLYSDLNFHVLAELVRRTTGEALPDLAHRKLWGPLGMADTGWLPDKALRSRIAPTERDAESGQILRGVVHDPTSRRMGGVTGHAGLFATAADLARFCRSVLGSKDAGSILHRETIREMGHAGTDANSSRGRGLGWDVRPVFAPVDDGDPPAGTHLAYGHTGWTGTMVWIDPGHDLFVVLLTNRNHPDGGDVRRLRQDVVTLATEAARPLWQVRNGIDVLREESFASLRGARVGLITNHTGRSRDGKSTIDLLHAAPDVTLVRLFSPEHGIRGELDQNLIEDGKDEKTGLPVLSLYGEHRAPQPESLQDLDALVFDIQDVGCRFYTYASTMYLAMDQAARHGLRFIVLDRLNPLGGERRDGPVTLSRNSFTGHHPVPLRHGLTLGELARLYAAERKLELKLEVVPIRGWRRSLTLDETGQPWVNPSPNLRNLEQAALYPGIGFLEFLHLSVGRGTDRPFQLVGAPWLDGEALAEALQAESLPGLSCRPSRFTPASSVFAKEECQGVSLAVTDRHVLRSLDVGLVIARYLSKHHREACAFDEKIDVLLCHPPTVDALRDGRSIGDIRKFWQPELEDFERRIAKILLYRD